MENLSEMKIRRRALGLTQQELALKSNVSQSLIAKIESGLLDPGYSKTKQIFDALEKIAYTTDIQAKEFMQKKIITVKQEEKATKVIKMMKQHAISQVPVVENKQPIGIITERSILHKLSEGDITQLLAKDVMEACPPVISPQTSKKALLDLLQHFPAVLVADHGVLKGFISKSDLLERIL